MRKFAYAAFVLISMVSCRNDTMDIVLDNSVLTTATPLKEESINFEFPVTTVNIFIVNDSLAVVHNAEQTDRKLVEIYNLNSGALVWEYFSKGNGPEEILMGRSGMFNDTLLLEDFMRDRFVLVPVDRIISGEHFRPEFHSYSVITPRFKPFKGKLLAINPNRFIDKQAGINNDGDRFILTDSSFSYQENRKYQYETSNVTNGNIIVSYENDRVIYYSANQPLIEVYDTDLNLVRTVSGPELPMAAEFSLIGPMVIYSNGLPYAYTQSCSNSEYVYIAYIGELTTAEKNYDEFDTRIFKFDWNGNFIDSYLIDISVTGLSLSEDGRTLYVFGREHDGTDVLKKYNLE